MHMPFWAILGSFVIATFLVGSPAGGAAAGAAPAIAALPVATLSPLFFSEGWKQPPAPGERPATQEAVSSPNLLLGLYGVGAKDIQLSGDSSTPARPLNLWTGSANTAIAVTLRDKDNYADLTGLGKMRLVTRVSGFHHPRPVVKLADGKWYIGDVTMGSHTGFNQSEFAFADVRWLALDIEQVYTRGNWVSNVDLSKVDEIGVADLIPGSGHGAGGWINIGKMEVYAKSVKR